MGIRTRDWCIRYYFNILFYYVRKITFINIGSKIKKRHTEDVFKFQNDVIWFWNICK